MQVHDHYYGYWYPGAKAPSHQYPQCWLKFYLITDHEVFFCFSCFVMMDFPQPRPSTERWFKQCLVVTPADQDIHRSRGAQGEVRSRGTPASMRKTHESASLKNLCCEYQVSLYYYVPQTQIAKTLKSTSMRYESVQLVLNLGWFDVFCYLGSA